MKFFSLFEILLLVRLSLEGEVRLKWVKLTEVNKKTDLHTPDGWVRGPVYFIRLTVKGHHFPATWSLIDGTITYPSFNKSVNTEEYYVIQKDYHQEYLTRPKGAISWISVQGKDVPFDRMISVGTYISRKNNKEAAYPCRAFIESTKELRIGYYNNAEGGCLISGDKDHTLFGKQIFEVPVINLMGLSDGIRLVQSTKEYCPNNACGAGNIVTF